MVKAVEDTARVNYFTVLDCLEDTFRSVKLSQIAVAVLGAASDLVDPIRTCLRPTLPGTLGAAHGGDCSGRCLPGRNDNGRPVVQPLAPFQSKGLLKGRF